MANTYTSDLGAAEGRIKSLTQAVSSGISGLPGITDALRKAVYEREKTLPALEVENENKIKELYTADKRYAERYANPENEMYIENPMARRGAISGQKADIRGELGGILNLIQQRSQTIGNAIDKGMELYKYGLEAQKLELEMAEKEWDRTWKKYQDEESKKGGSGKDYSAYGTLLKGLLEAKPDTTPSGEYSFNTLGGVEGEDYTLTGGVDKEAYGQTTPGGQWQWGPNGWEPTAAGSTLQKLVQATMVTPESASIAFSNWGDIQDMMGGGESTFDDSAKWKLYASAYKYIVEQLGNGATEEQIRQQLITNKIDPDDPSLMNAWMGGVTMQTP